MTKDITTLLKEATKDLLSEQTLNEIKGAFNAAVDGAVQIHVEKALKEQDEDYSGKLEKLLEAIDTDHSAKLERVVEAIDISHTDKLKKIVSGYESSIANDASVFKESLITNLDKYLDLYLEEKIPTNMVKEAVENTRSAKLLAEVRTILGVDMAMASESIREAVLDGKTIIEDYRKSLGVVQAQYKELNENFKQQSAELVLEKTTADLPDAKKSYMKKMLQGKNAEYITENFDYVLDLFDKKEEDRLEILKEQAVTGMEAMQVDRPVTESVEANETQESSGLNRTYLTELNKF
jgi:hypothetical protein|tara:strand:- start:417 stop:1298 length:882 start_codon:yes stop_codon:yes gene_type:complete